ncbi:hypothetical protein R4Z09_11350 [Niallia oryzisoli]|uniref:Uncharacterized protein n=1 Tax=Niallia oryzisoli TaxID=1737571 RepID=A0ABZ2CKA0_9BACI
MKLYQVRKGQFVYFNNELHKVYGVKPMYKQSVHLIRLRDVSQHLTNAASVERYKPKERDSFIFNQKAYTLNKDRNAEEGDYILINNPMPDSLDTYSLNEIELVEKSDRKGVITSNSHGVKHHEYLLMVPGRAKDSHPIDYQNLEGIEADHLSEGDFPANQLIGEIPVIGDVYKKKDSVAIDEAMIVAIKGQTVYLGDGSVLSQEELLNTENWEFLYNLLEK